MLRNVLHLRSSGGILGAENVIIELGKHSPEFGYRSYIGAIKYYKDDYPEFLNLARESGIETTIFEMKNKFDPSIIKEIKRFIKGKSIHILHCHGYKEDLLGLLTPVNIPKIATNHLWKRTTYRLKVYAKIDAFLLRFFDKVVGVSDEIVHEMDKLGINNSVKIPNGVDIDKFYIGEKNYSYYDKLGINHDTIILGMVSSLTPEKGHTTAIQAFHYVIKEIPNVCLLIVGDGNYKKVIKQEIERNGLDRYIMLVGKQQDIPQILSIIDIFLQPSFKEGLPMSLLEAMSAGKAVIATRVGEIPKVITHGQTGILINPGDARQLKEEILDLLQNQKEIIRLGQNARIIIEQNYNSKRMAEDYCGLYDSYIKQVA